MPIKTILPALWMAACPVIFSSCRLQQPILSQAPSAWSTEGRVIQTDSGTTRLFWPGTQVQTIFTGAGLRAQLRDENGRNHIAVIIDDSLYKTIRLRPGLHEYILAENLSAKSHSMVIHKLTDWFDGESEFIRFIYPGNTKTKGLAPKKWKLEFYGNSITVGAGMFSRNGADWPGTATYNYYSYGAIAARQLGASARFIASSGIGLMVSWGNLIMPDIYDRCNPADSSSLWNFDEYTPDVVVINLLQNDQALVNQPGHSQFIRRFGQMPPGADTIIARYTAFVARIRLHYPKAYILCCLGSMSAVRPGSPFPGYIRRAVAALNDKQMSTFFFRPIKGNEHPDRNEQQQMANELLQVLRPILEQR